MSKTLSPNHNAELDDALVLINKFVYLFDNRALLRTTLGSSMLIALCIEDLVRMRYLVGSMRLVEEAQPK